APPFADRFLVGAAGSPERKALMIQAMIPTIRRLGVTLHNHSYYDPLLYATGGWRMGSLFVRPTKSGRYSEKKVKQKLLAKTLEMIPPLYPTPAALEAGRKAWQAKARKMYDAGVRMIQIDDERRMSGDFDRSEQTLGAFRRWLRKRYADIGQLNRAWEAAFDSFDEVVPKTRTEVADSASKAPWLEFRMFIGEVLGEYYMKAPAQWAAQISPDLAVGEYGIYEPVVDWPIDWSRYAKWYRHTARYGSRQGVLEELMRCFGEGATHGQWMGYGMSSLSPARRVAPWRSLLNGGRFALYWEIRDPGYLNYAIVTSDQRPTKAYAGLARQEWPDLTGGIDRLVIASRFTADPIGLAYSYPSWLLDREALGPKAKIVLEQLGYQYNYVNLEDLPAAALEKGGYRLFVVDHVECLSPGQIAALRRFVERGGTLLVIGLAGRYDLHGAPHPGGRITDALTGVDTSKAVLVNRLTVLPAGRDPMHLQVACRDVGVTSAKPLRTAEVDGAQTPVLTARSIGAGKAYWLNATLAGHSRVVTGGVNDEISIVRGGPRALQESYLRLLEAICRDAGLSPRCRLYADGRPVLGTETWYYRTPSGRSLFVARYLMREAPKPLEVGLTRPGHVYEMRSGKYLGHGKTFSDAFPAGRMKVYAVLDYRVAGVSAEPSVDAAAPGQTVIVTCRVRAQGAKPDLHAVRIRVTGPDGKDLPEYAAVLLAPGGQGEHSIPLALNQQPGRYRVDVTDVISGQSARATLEVRRAESPRP
ncbi:MAG: beta-galactosidase, partial [Planctomycetota bacterium]